jgi:spermidine/putrescine transport system ATP-binding protein
VMDMGEIIQEGGPEEIYSAPKTRFVSTFIGEANIFAGTRKRDVLHLDSGATASAPGRDGPVTAVVRPEAMQISRSKLSTDVERNGTLVDIIYLGGFVKYIVALPSGQRVAVHNSSGALRRSLAISDPIKIGWDREDQRVVEG